MPPCSDLLLANAKNVSVTHHTKRELCLHAHGLHLIQFLFHLAEMFWIKLFIAEQDEQRKQKTQQMLENACDQMCLNPLVFIEQMKQSTKFLTKLCLAQCCFFCPTGFFFGFACSNNADCCHWWWWWCWCVLCKKNLQSASTKVQRFSSNQQDTNQFGLTVDR